MGVKVQDKSTSFEEFPQRQVGLKEGRGDGGKGLQDFGQHPARNYLWAQRTPAEEILGVGGEGSDDVPNEHQRQTERKGGFAQILSISF